MAEQRMTNRSDWTVYVNGAQLLSGESMYVNNDDGTDLRCNEGMVTVRVIEWPDETTELVIVSAGA